MAVEEKSVPLLEPSPKGTSSSAETLGNIIISIVGTGVLGLPYAFRIAGWLAGSIGVIIAGISTFYCMLLLVQCRDKLETEESTQIVTYGDLGAKAFGRTGRYLTEFLVLISQCGGAVAYLVFIGQNLASIFKTHNVSFSTLIFCLVPIQIALSWIRSLSTFAPFSAFADICNVLAMAIVVKEDLQLFDGLSKRKAIVSISGLPFAGGVAVFCFEGFSMTLALEASMRERSRFRRVLSLAFLGITLVYVCFGFFGYLAYGEETRDIITLNLPNGWSTMAVKVGLCVALTFTFPIMMHPVHEIIEEKLKASTWFRKLSYDSQSSKKKLVLHASRALFVVALAIVASFVPGFGVLISLVGSTVCALLSFVLPAMFHLIFMRSSLDFRQKTVDLAILVFGLVFAGYGTYNAVGVTDSR
ncbi:aromatic and neutral transporter 1 [Tasmannia lanceolata]|uniref:aromatic and neutral transporter 1 n=1 Tax=Tasmannia lanceolata TaxID=3420 RepID=UPI004063D53D